MQGRMICLPGMFNLSVLFAHTARIIFQAKISIFAIIFLVRSDYY